MANTYETITDYDMIQTFYADPEIVAGSGEFAVTSVDLYFRGKPSSTRNISGKTNPGVMIRICEVNNDEPDLTKVYHNYTSYKSFDEIFSFSDASSATTFGFTVPLKLKTGRFYGIVVILEDPSYEIWVNKAGDRLVNTTNISPGSNRVKDGKLFLKNNTSVFRSLSDTDLKFGINCAQYTANTLSEVYVNKDYEFFTLSGIAGRFLGGEYVYQAVANAAGSVSFVAGQNIIIGTGTSFLSDVVNGDRIVLFGNTTYTQVVPILNVVNNTYLEVSTKIVTSNSSSNYMKPPVGRVHYFDKVLNQLFLVDSSANSTVLFQANANPVTAEDSRATATISSVDTFTVDRLRLRADINTPPAGSVNNNITLAYYNGSSYIFDPSKQENILLNQNAMFNVSQYDGFILSRSLEALNSNLASNSTLLFVNKSIVVNTDIQVNLSNTNLYQSPTIDSDVMDMYVVQNLISNTYTATDANNVVFDTEVYGNGTALSKHISTKLKFANNRFAEDVRLIMLAYRPANTDLKIYVRLHNSTDSDAFDDKAWSPLVYKENADKFSSRDDRNDLIEYELGLPQYPDSANVLPGTFSTTLDSKVIQAAGVDPSTYVATNDMVKLYNPLIPEDYVIGVVDTANTTAIVLGDVVSNNNVVGSGFVVDRLKYYNTAFNNITNDNVARYYSTTLVEFDTYDTIQYKIVFLSDTSFKVPEVEQVQFIGVSA